MFGREFYFGNLMFKAVQMPMLWYESSEFGANQHEGTFLVLIYEKAVDERKPKKNPLLGSKTETPERRNERR